jgi:3-isopropylmalate/(R)-2-methylmalate dehydratase small subunit
MSGGDSVVRGRAWKYGDDIECDSMTKRELIRMRGDIRTEAFQTELAKHAMYDVDRDFPQKVRKGDFIVAGLNFGCGHGLHWEVPVGLKKLGVAAVIAESFARDFFRTAISFGLPLASCKGVTKEINEGDELEFNLRTGEIRDLTTGKAMKAVPLPNFLIEVVEAGDIYAYVKKQIALTKGERQLLG